MPETHDEPAPPPAADAQAQAAFRLVQVLHGVDDLAVVREGIQRVLISYRVLAEATAADSRTVGDYLDVMEALDGVAAAVQRAGEVSV